MKGCVISAPMTGSGKTTVTLGLMAKLVSAGMKVQPFKVGPDFIDPGLHELATRTPSHNLDGWMLSREANLELFARATADKDVAIVEGVMGLFDGAEGGSNTGSTAEMALWLGLPIVLVVDAHPLARSAAAIVHGFRTFDPSVRIAGVIFNRVAGASHFRILCDALQGVPILGWLPQNPEIEIRERHLGLLTAGEQETRLRVERIRDFFASYIDVNRVVDVMADLRSEPEPPGRGASLHVHGTVRVALAHDAGFSFYYQANRDALKRAGAKIIEFSPITDSKLPDADFLYLGGGYPELYRRQLEANQSMRDSVRTFIESGKRFYAECGGLMYLAKAIDQSEMVGVIPTEIQLTERPVDFGYCEITTTQPSILGLSGTHLRGHQFHYSRCSQPSSNPVYVVRQREREYGEGWFFPNGIASYVHLHFLSNPAVATSVLQS